MRKLWYILFFSICIHGKAMQPADSISFLYTKVGGVGLSNITSSNNLVSQLVFKGMGIGLLKSIYSEGNNHSWVYNSNFSYAYLSNNANIYGVSFVYFNNNFSYLFTVNKLCTEKFKLKVGATSHAFIDVNYKSGNLNNPFAYVCYISLGAAIHANYSFNFLNYKSVLNNYTCIPAVGFVSSSPYANSQPDFEFKFYSFEFASFNKIRDIYNNFYLDLTNADHSKKSRFSWRIGVCSHITYQPSSNNNKMLNTTFYIGRIVKLYN
jgi:hypothetical protein